MRGEALNAEHLYQIVIYCECIGRAVESLNDEYDNFVNEKNKNTCDSCAFYVGKVGEYATKLTEKFRAEHSEIIWHQIIGLRNRIFHDYRSVKKATLWNIMREELGDTDDAR